MSKVSLQEIELGNIASDRAKIKSPVLPSSSFNMFKSMKRGRKWILNLIVICIYARLSLEEFKLWRVFASWKETGRLEGWGKVRNGGGRDTIAYSFVPSGGNYYLFNNQIQVYLILCFLHSVFSNFLRVLECWAGERSQCALPSFAHFR